jgi:hypothetical protein
MYRKSGFPLTPALRLLTETGQDSCGFPFYKMNNSRYARHRRLEIRVVPLKRGDKGDALPWKMSTGRGEVIWEW